MQTTYCPLTHPDLLAGRPTLGALMALCEENYGLLARLVPNLDTCQGRLISSNAAGLDLHLTIESQSRYTTDLRLTYLFESAALRARHPALGADPDALLRAYHDARQVEVLGLRQTALPRHADYRPPALASKWRLNQFLGKWLAFCAAEGHRFGAVY